MLAHYSLPKHLTQQLATGEQILERAKRQLKEKRYPACEQSLMEVKRQLILTASEANDHAKHSLLRTRLDVVAQQLYIKSDGNYGWLSSATLN